MIASCALDLEVAWTMSRAITSPISTKQATTMSLCRSVLVHDYRIMAMQTYQMMIQVMRSMALLLR